MSTENVDIVVSETGADQAAKGIEQVGTQATETAKNTEALTKQTEALKTGWESLKLTIESLGLYEIAKQLIEIADSYTLLQARLGLVTTSTQQLSAVTNELIEISEQTRTSFEANADFFAKTADEADHLGISQKELLEVQKLLNESFIASGATSQQAGQGLAQLERAFATGTVSGRPLLQLLKEFPVTAKALADGLGTSVAGLQQLSQKGGLSVKEFADALTKSGEQINVAFGKIPVTVGQAFDVLKERVTLYIAQANETYNITGKIAQVLLAVANAFPAFVTGLKAAGEAYLIFRTALLAQDGYNAVLKGLNAIQTALNLYIATSAAAGVETTVLGRLMVALSTPFASITQAFRDLSAVIAANPLVTTITVFGLLVVALQNYGNSIDLVNNKYQGHITVLGLVLGITRFVIRVFLDTAEAIKNLVTGVGSLGDVWDAVSAKYQNIHDYTVQATTDLTKQTDGTQKLKDVTDSYGNSLDNLKNKALAYAPLNTDAYDAKQREIAILKQTKEAWDKYAASVDAETKIIEDNALKTRNALGDVVTATDEWARRSGADFNAVAQGAATMAGAISKADEQIVAATAAAVSAETTGSSGGGAISSGYGDFSNNIDEFLRTGTLPAGDSWASLLSEVQGIQDANQKAGLINMITADAKAAGAPGFADGGSMTVGGNGGVDSQLVTFLATPGETVTVNNKNQQRQKAGRRGGGGTTINMTVNTPDANSFRRSQAQTLLSVKSKLAQVG